MLVIIHGWSDSSKSFEQLVKLMVAEGVVAGVEHIRLGDYVSLDDDVTFDDLIHALKKAWADKKLPTKPRSVDMIVHSTGGLVVRHWMTSFFKATTNPVHRLLMLAPANFGSPLAHKGASFIGRAVKGFKSDRRFHVGAQILKGLELASPFTWALSQQDRFGGEEWYGPGRVLCTVLVGTAGYTGISAAANENGTDGTVRVSTAHLNPAMVTLDFATNPQKPTLSYQEAKGLTAFARIPEENHSTIVLKDKGPKSNHSLAFIKEALQVTDQTFPAFVMKLNNFSATVRASEASRRYTQAYQNTVVRLTDDMGAFVSDYFLEIFAKSKTEKSVDNQLTRMIQEEVFEKVHVYGDNASYRSLLFNTVVLDNKIVTAGIPLFMSVTAMPDIGKTKSVGYSTFGYDDIGSIRISQSLLLKLFQHDRTLLVDLKIKREQTDKVFRLLNL
jgi:hypothetical protein